MTSSSIKLDPSCNYIFTFPIPLIVHVLAKEAEAQANVKLVGQGILDQEVNKIVEGDDSAAVEFIDSLILSHKDPDTKIDPRSHKERPKVVNVDDDNVEVKEESA
ncbi:hypothetical protein Tco_0456076 [Tanacetum coccineum]